MVSAEPILQPQGITDESPDSPIHSLTHLIDHRAEHRGDQPAIFTQEPDSNKLKILTYADIKKATERLAWHYHGLRLPGNASEAPPSPGRTNETVGIFFRSSLNLTMTEFAMHRLGQAALLISPNNPASAVAGLLKATNTHVIIAGEKLYDTASEAVELLTSEGYDIKLLPEQVFPLFGPDGIASVKVQPYPLRLSFLRTGFPKPLPGTHKSVLANGASTFGLAAATVLPLFHGFGHHASLRCIAAAKPLFVYPPHLPTTAANITRFLETCRAASPEPIKQLFAVAYILKLLSESDEATASLAKFDVVSFAGSALPDEVGDRLTAANVRLISQFGTTETGTCMTSMRHFREDRGWNWLRITDAAKPYVVMEERGAGVYECIVKNGFGSLAITNRPDGFATKDLFLQNPEHSDQWKYCGRADDTLTQTLGEKTNPLPMELDIRGYSEFITEAIVFGDGRPQIGCLILPSDACRKMTPEAIRELVQPAVDFANKSAPSHSQIQPELVHVLPIGTEVPLATKGSILRPACYAKFKNLIDKIYEVYNSSSSTSKLSLDIDGLQAHIVAILEQTIGKDKAKIIQPETDLFNFGVDSLQSSRIRLLLMRSIDIGDHELSQNVVYEHPSISKLAAHLLALRTGGIAVTQEEQDKQAYATMQRLVEKYTTTLEEHSSEATAVTPSQQVVVLTGATGALGAHILAQLVALPSVDRVYALVRAKDDKSAAERVASSIKQRKITSIDSVQAEKIVSLASNIDKPDLGLTHERYSEIRDSATAVIANAWSVNFNLSVESFEADNIRAAHNLINLCLRSPHQRPARFYFSSSVSTRQGKWTESAKEEITKDPSYAVSTGYGRSKWITEKICQIASETRGLHCGVLRIGQMAGDTEHGVWNTTEAIPLMFRTAQVIKALPILDDYPSYLPVDTSAKGIVEIVMAGDLGPTSRLYHIVNPSNTTSFDKIYDFFEAAGVRGFDRLERREWLKRLEASPSDPAINPSYKLLDFFRKRFAGETLNPQIIFEVTETSKIAPSIGSCPPITQDLVSKWVASWRKVGFFE